MSATEESVGEDDLALIDALHLNPRARFSQIAAALGVSTPTARRHWQRLVSEGEAWISSVPGPALQFVGSLVEVGYRPARLDAVLDHLCAIPQVASVHVVGGDPGIYTLVIAGNPSALDHVVFDLMGSSPDTTMVRPAVMTELFAGRTWGLGALSRMQRAELGQEGTLVPRAAGPDLDDADRRLFVELQWDGRASAQALSDRLDLPEHTVRRRIDRLTRSGVLAFRTDFVRQAGGWPVQVAVQLEVPDGSVGEVGRHLAALPQTRVCASVVAGPTNVFVTFQLHEVQTLDGVLMQLRQRYPAIAVVSRRVVIRSVKSWGRVLDPAGRAAVTIPVDPWAQGSTSRT